MEVIRTEAFVPTPAVPALDDDEIHVWLLELPADTAHKAVAIAADAVRDRLLASYAGAAQAPTMARGAHGKPYAPQFPQLEFNLSHSGAQVLLAFARQQALGIDLERGERRHAFNDIAQRYFAASEAAALARLDEPSRRHAFLRLWTCKEAVMKAIGRGLAYGLDQVVLEVDHHALPQHVADIGVDDGPATQWRIVAFEDPHWSGALAWRGGARTLRTLRVVG